MIGQQIENSSEIAFWLEKGSWEKAARRWVRGMGKMEKAAWLSNYKEKAAGIKLCQKLR